MHVLSVKNLCVTVFDGITERGLLEDVSFDVPENSIVSLVGGSGSGKTTTGLAVLGLLPLALRVTSGGIFFRGKNLLGQPYEYMREVRGKDISMIFQEPLHAFNPVFSVGYQIEEVLTVHTPLNRRQRRERIEELLELVGMPDPRRVARNYPHQLSGGMRQRAMIAQAIAAGPKLLIADEPTSNLDVTLQAKIIELFRKLMKELDLSILLITHDLGMVAHTADETAVMSEGRVVEKGGTREILTSPQHEYTRKLMEAMLVM